MSKHKFPSPPPVVKKSTGDARNSATQPNTSVISVNTSINADTNPDTLVSWIDSLKARVSDTLTQQTSELQQLRISAKQEELRLRYRSHVFLEPFDKLGVYLEQEAHKQQQTELAVNDEKEALPFIEEEETALVKEYEYSPYPEEAPELEYQNSDVIEIISDEEDGEDDAKEQYADSESDLEIENSQAIENYDDNVDYDDNVEYDENVDYDEFEIEDHNDNDDETANVGKTIRYEELDDVQDEPQEEYPEYLDEFEGFEEEQHSLASRSVVSDDELEAYSSLRPKQSFQLKDGRPRLSDMSSYNYFQQDTNEYLEDDAEENLAKEEENEENGKEEEVASEENEDEDQEEEERSPQSQIQPAPEDEVDSIIILSSGEEDATDSEDQPIVETQYSSEGRDDDSEEMVHSEMESSEVENYENHSQEIEGSGTTESSKHLQSHIAESSGVESDAEQDLPNESNSKDLATYDDEHREIHEVADENNLFANIAQEALVEEHIPLGTKINSDYLADVESDEPPKPVVSSEAGPILENEAKLHVEEKTSLNIENKTEVPNFDSTNLSSQFDLGTLSGPKNEDEDASEGSLADAESDFRKMDDIPEENIPHPSLKFPIFKTIKSESLEEVLKKLEETEQKFHIKLHAVEELKSELGISEEPEEVPNVSVVLSGHPTEPNRLDAYSAADQSHATTFHDALLLDSLAMEDLEHIPSELTHSVLADLESDASLDAIVNEALLTHIPELDNASIDAILGGSELPRVEDEPVQESEDMEMENSEQVEAVELVEHPWEEEPIDQITEETLALSETEEGLVLLHETAESGEALPLAGTTPPPESSSELEVGADVLQVVSNFKSDLRAIEVPTLDEFEGATDSSMEELVEGSEITEKSAKIEDDEFILEDGDKMSESEDVPAGEDLISEVEGDTEDVDLDAGSAEEETETETETETEAQADSKDRQVLPQEEAMIELTVSQPDIEQVAGEEETTPEIEEISSSDEVVAENVMQNVGPLGIGSDLDEFSVRGEELSEFENASFVPNDFHIPRYEMPSLPVLERIDSFSDEGVDVIEPKSPDEVIVEYDEFAVVEADATTPTSIEEPTIPAPEETIPDAVIATEVLLDTTADVETPTNIVEPTEVEEEILVEVFDDNSDVVTPSAILELESMRNTPVPVFSHAISVEEIREPQQPLSKKRKIDGDERSSFKRIKTAWTRLNPLNWFGLKDKQEESDEEQPQTANNHGQADYSDDLRGIQRSQNNEDRNENESENIDQEVAVEVDEDHDNALEILKELAIEVVEAISDDMSAVVENGDDENGGDPENQALLEAIEHVKEAAHETFEAISEDIYAPVEGEDSEGITIGESLKDLGESVGETLDNLREAGHEVIEALSEDITAPVKGEVVDKEGANDHIYDGGSESFGETIDHMKAAGEEVVHAISEEISAPVEGEEVKKAAHETQEESSETLEQTLDHMIEAGIEVIETISEDISAPIEGDEVEKDDERHVDVSGNIMETIHCLEEAGKELTDAISESISAPVEGEEVNKTEELEDTHIDIAESLLETITIVKEASKQFVDAISEDISAPFENEETRDVLELESAKEDAGTDMHTHVGKHFLESISRMKQAGKELVDAISEEISAPVENEIVDIEFQKEDESNESFLETVDQVKRAAQAVVEAVSEEISAPLSDQEDYASAKDEDAHTAKEETHVDATREFLDNLKGAAKGVYDELNEDLSVAVSSSDLTKDGTSPGEANQDYETDNKADLSFSETLSNIKKAAEEVVAAISEDILQPVADNIAENETGNVDAALLSPILDVPSDNSAFKVPTTADDDTTTTGPNIPPVPVFNLISPLVESLVSTKKSSEVPEILEVADVHLDNNKSSKVPGTKVADSKVQVLMDMFKKKAEALIEKHEHEDPDAEKPVTLESEDLKTEQISRKQEDDEQSEDSITDISDNEETTAEKAIQKKVQPASRKRSQRKRKVMGIDIGSDVDLTHRRALRSGATADEQEENTDILTDKTESLGGVKKEQEFTSVESKDNAKPRRKLKIEVPEVKSDESKVLSRTNLLSPAQEVETGSPRKSKVVSSKPLELPKKRGRGRPPKKSKRNRATSSALEVGGTDSRTPSGKLEPSLLDHPALRTRSKSPIKRTIQELSLEIDEDQPRKKRVTRSAVQKRIEEVEAKKEEQGHDKDHEQDRRGRTRERH